MYTEYCLMCKEMITSKNMNKDSKGCNILFKTINGEYLCNKCQPMYEKERMEEYKRQKEEQKKQEQKEKFEKAKKEYESRSFHSLSDLLSDKQKNKIIQWIANNNLKILEDIKDIYGCDFHNEVCNTEYFHKSLKNLESFFENKTWEMIEYVKNYEIDNFGETNTEIKPDKIINMIAYIFGEELLNECETLKDNWDNILEVGHIEKIRFYLTSILK